MLAQILESLAGNKAPSDNSNKKNMKMKELSGSKKGKR